jgi:hypothetical protein
MRSVGCSLTASLSMRYSPKSEVLSEIKRLQGTPPPGKKPGQRRALTSIEPVWWPIAFRKRNAWTGGSRALNFGQWARSARAQPELQQPVHLRLKVALQRLR